VLSVLAEPLLTIIAAMTRELAQLTKRVVEIVTRFDGEITVRNRQPTGLEQVVSFKSADGKSAN